jgi:DNA-binding transcriptional ArsR family regulator
MAPNGEDELSAGNEPPLEAAPGEQLFRALAHPVRLHILMALAAGPRAYTDLRRRVGAVAETPSSSRGKFNYHLDALERARLIEQRDDAYVLASLGRSALRLIEGASEAPAIPDTPAGPAPEILTRTLRGVLAAVPAGATMIILVLLAEAATLPAGAAPPPLSALLPWGLATSMAVLIAVALFPLPSAQLASTTWSRLARNASLALLGGLVAATPYEVYQALLLHQPFSERAAAGWALVLILSVAWFALLNLGQLVLYLKERIHRDELDLPTESTTPRE